MESRGRRRRLRRLVRSPRFYATSVLVAALVGAQMSGLGEFAGDRDRVQDFLTETGALGPVVFVALFALSHPVGLPSVALTFVAGLVWPAPLAVLLAWLGGMAGTLIAFSVARWLGRDWVAARLPERFRRLEARVERRAVRTVAAVRLVTYLPPPADWVFGISTVRLRQFVVGTAVGIVPPTVVIVLAGDRFVDWVGGNVELVAGLGAAVAALFVLAVVVRRRQTTRVLLADEIP